MNESEFNDNIDELIMLIEEQLDESDSDVDYETHSGILTIELVNGSQIIINRQSSNFQLWLAAKSGGYHFDLNQDSKQWLDTKTSKNFIDVLNQCLSEQSGDQYNLSL